MEIVPTNTHQRVAQWQAAFPVIEVTVQAGEEVLVHCVAGRHRAAAVGVLLRTIFTAEPIAQSDAWISSGVILSCIASRMIAEWAHG